jgi:hypothetical protein
MLSNFAELASIGVRLFCEVFTNYVGKSQFIFTYDVIFHFHQDEARRRESSIVDPCRTISNKVSPAIPSQKQC